MQALIQEQQKQKERFQTDQQTGMAEQLKAFTEQLKELRKENESLRAKEQQRSDDDHQQNEAATWTNATSNRIDPKYLTQYATIFGGKWVDKDQP